MSERWRPCVGFEGLYEVSDQGRVRSVLRVVKNRGSGLMNSRKGMLRRQEKTWNGYMRVPLSKNGKAYKRLVHRLVASAFVKGRGRVVRHKNGQRDDNRATNLMWGTHSDNAQDSIKHGTFVRGERNGRAKLTTKQVGTIKIRRQSGESTFQIWKSYRFVDYSTIKSILKGKSRVHA